MKIIESLDSMFEYSEALRKKGKKIGFVPTMGYLHEGHLSLVGEAKKRSDVTVVSIYVNPTQFNNPEDYQNYPIDIAKDVKILEENRTDVLFLPKTEEIYSGDARDSIIITIPSLMKNLCAPFRPGHFEGVLQIVSKLFHIVNPNIAIFGLKDYQQYLIISKMVEYLNFPIEIVGMETLREKTGLALSSRNVRLKLEEQQEATLLFRALNMGKEFSQKKNSNPGELISFMKEILLSSSKITIEYLEVLDSNTLAEKEELKGNILIAGAIYLRTVRLIDNLRFSKI